MLNLYQFTDLLEKNPLTIATVNDNGQPNLAVAADVKVISENQLLIAHNEMIKTITNIKNWIWWTTNRIRNQPITVWIMSSN